MIDRTVQNRVGHESFGGYQAVFNLALIFQIVLDFGLNNFNSRTISRSPGRLKELFPKMLSARLFLLLFYILIVCATGWLLGYKGKQIVLLGGVLAIQAIVVLLQFVRSNVAALQHFRIDGVLSVTDRFFMIVVCSVLLFYPAVAAGFKIEWFIAAQIVCYGITLVIAYMVLKRLSGISLGISLHPGEILDTIKKSFPYALLIFLMSVYTRADVVLIERMCDAREAGIYSSAYRLLDAGNILGLMFAAMLLPMFGKMIVEKTDMAPIIRTSVNVLLPVSLSVAIAAFFYGGEIMHMLYPVAGEYDGKVFAAYMACFPAFCIMYVYSTLLTANGSLKTLNILALAGVVVNLGLNFYFIPKYQALGGGIVAFITQSMLAVGFIVFAQKELKLPHNPKWVSAIAAFAIVIFPLAYGSRQLALDWKVQLGCFGVVCLLLMFVFRFISIHSLKALAASKTG